MKKSILVVTENRSASDAISGGLSNRYESSFLDNLEDGPLAALSSKSFEVLFADIDALLSGLRLKDDLKEIETLLQRIRNRLPGAHIVVMTSPDRIRETVNVIQAGASAYLTYPIDPLEIRHTMESLQETRQMQLELDYLRDQFWQVDAWELVRTNSSKMQEVFNKVRTVAAKKVTVLLTGETGTGKGVIARLLHQHSKRGSDQFIGVHCGAIPDTLLESELFGHEKGAFTGATRQKPGKFEIANGGTIFLDEIGTITPSMQVKLLQILQEGVIQRIGNDKPVEVDVRIIAATNEDLNRRRLDGTFRGDLFYRLNVFPIELPPLRDRLEDIPLLVEVFLARLNRLYLKNISYIHRDVLEAFRRYDWPGNIRELENLVERAYLLEESDTLSPECFPNDLFSTVGAEMGLSVDPDLTLADFRRVCYESLEAQYLNELLSKHKGVIGRSAEAAGITPRQLHRLMAKHNISKEAYKSGSA